MAINTTTVKECPVPMPFRYPASSLHSRTVMTHEFRLIFLPLSFVSSSTCAILSRYCLRHRFFEACSSHQCSCSWKSIRVWSSFRNERVGMRAFSEGGCAGRACELCVSETADIFATRLFVKLIMLEEINGAIYKINMLFKMGCASRTLMFVTLKIDDLKLSCITTVRENKLLKSKI